MPISDDSPIIGFLQVIQMIIEAVRDQQFSFMTQQPVRSLTFIQVQLDKALELAAHLGQRLEFSSADARLEFIRILHVFHYAGLIYDHESLLHDQCVLRRARGGLYFVVLV